MNTQGQKSGANPGKREEAAPPLPLFDKLEAVKRLKNAEFGEKQAVTLVETLQDAQNGLATKADLEKAELALRTDLEKMESGIRVDMKKMESGIRADMEKMESGIRADMEKMESGIRADMKEMEFRLRNNFESHFTKLHRFLLVGGGVMASIISGMIAILGVVIALAK